MKSDSWEFLLYDENTPTVFGSWADSKLLRFRQKIEKFMDSSEVLENNNKED
jgi:hypothetical protein